MKVLGAPPLVFGGIAVFFAGVGLCQILLFKGREPRQASLFGGFVMGVVVAIAVAVTGSICGRDEHAGISAAPWSSPSFSSSSADRLAIWPAACWPPCFSCARSRRTTRHLGTRSVPIHPRRRPGEVRRPLARGPHARAVPRDPAERDGAAVFGGVLGLHRGGRLPLHLLRGRRCSTRRPSSTPAAAGPASTGRSTRSTSESRRTAASGWPGRR